MSETNYQEIAAKFIDKGIHVFEQGTTGYNDSIRHVLQSNSQPAAFAVQPLTQAQLVETIKILGANKVPFAIKGGGSSRNPGASSTKGVQIYMTFFDEIKINEKENYIDVGAGCLWNRVYAALREKNKDVVGADDLNSSVAGFLLGGGYSLKSHKYGLGIDHIREVEVVLSDGQVMTVTGNGNGSDLFQALKGGGNNFGIVTRFKLQTHERETSWSGTFIFESQCEQEVTDAIEQFARKETRHKVALISTFHSFVDSGKRKDSISVTCQVHDSSKSQPNQQPWATFRGISERARMAPQFSGIRENRGGPFAVNRLPAEVEALPFGTLPVSQNPNTRGQICCIMVNNYTKKLIDAIASEAKLATQEMEKYGGISVSFQIWPFTTSLDSDGSNTPSAWPPSRAHALGPLVVSFMWEGLENNDKFWSERLQKALTSIKDAAHEAPYTDADAAPPVYPSLTSETTAQEVYGVNLNKLVDIRTRYDPDGNMSRGSGFKINNAKEEEAERARILLKRYDTIIIVDDSSSMGFGERWPHAQQALKKIAEGAAKHDSDGIDVLFLNATDADMKGLTPGDKDTDLTDLCGNVQPDGTSKLGIKIRKELGDYLDRIKTAKEHGDNRFAVRGLNLIVITDGQMDSDDIKLGPVITDTVNRLRDAGWNSKQIGINFVQVGNDDNVAKRFKHLDDDIATTFPSKNGRQIRYDLVDHTRYVGQTLDDELLDKMLLGGILKRIDASDV